MNTIRESLKAYLDGQLPADQMNAVREALSRDPGLRAELEQLQRISGTLREGFTVAAPTGLNKTLAVLARPKPRPPLALRLLPALAAVGACAAVVLIAGRLNSQPEPSFNDESPMPKHMRRQTAAQATEMTRTSGVRERTEAFTRSPDAVTADRSPAPVEPPIEPASAPVRVPKRTGPYQTQSAVIYIWATNVQKAADQLQDIAQSLHGLPANNEGGRVELSVDEDGFAKAVSEICALGDRRRVWFSTSDHAQEVAETRSRLSQLRMASKACLRMLRKDTRPEDVRADADRLAQTIKDINETSERERGLLEKASMSSIEVRFNFPPGR